MDLRRTPATARYKFLPAAAAALEAALELAADATDAADEAAQAASAEALLAEEAARINNQVRTLA